MGLSLPLRTDWICCFWSPGQSFGGNLKLPLAQGFAQAFVAEGSAPLSDNYAPSLVPGIWNPSAYTHRAHTHPGDDPGIPVSGESFPDDCKPPEVCSIKQSTVLMVQKDVRAEYLQGLWTPGGLARCLATP